jgi:hypothetical protein
MKPQLDHLYKLPKQPWTVQLVVKVLGYPCHLQLTALLVLDPL